MIVFNNLYTKLFLPPHHFINHSRIALNELHDFGADVFINIVRNRDTVVTVLDHLYGRVNSLQERVFVDAGENEATLVEGLWALGRCADADCRE